MSPEYVINEISLLNQQYRFDVEGIGIVRPFSVTTDGEQTCVDYLDQPLWDSENDFRDVDDHPGSSDGREPLRVYLIKEANKYLRGLGAGIILS